MTSKLKRETTEMRDGWWCYACTKMQVTVDSKNNAYLYLEKVLGWPVDLLERLLARVRHGLQDGAGQASHSARRCRCSRRGRRLIRRLRGCWLCAPAGRRDLLMLGGRRFDGYFIDSLPRLFWGSSEASASSGLRTKQGFGRGRTSAEWR